MSICICITLRLDQFLLRCDSLRPDLQTNRVIDHIHGLDDPYRGHLPHGGLTSLSAPMIVIFRRPWQHDAGRMAHTKIRSGPGGDDAQENMPGTGDAGGRIVCPSLQVGPSLLAGCESYIQLSVVVQSGSASGQSLKGQSQRPEI